jgi:hypothetical protein
MFGTVRNFIQTLADMTGQTDYRREKLVWEKMLGVELDRPTYNQHKNRLKYRDREMSTLGAETLYDIVHDDRLNSRTLREVIESEKQHMLGRAKELGLIPVQTDVTPV